MQNKSLNFVKGMKVYVESYGIGTIKKYFNDHAIVVSGTEEKGYFWTVICCNVVGCNSYFPAISLPYQKIDMPKLMWQTKPPTLNGFYWLKKSSKEIVYIFIEKDKIYVKSINNKKHENWSPDYKWIGPIKSPIK